jgi:RadC-like JAB domain
MKAITAILLILVSVLTIHIALGASTSDRPAGIDAASVILAHPHPSGVAEPPQADEAITTRLKS